MEANSTGAAVFILNQSGHQRLVSKTAFRFHLTEPETLECVQLYESRLADVDSLLVFNSFRLTGQKSSGKQQLLLRVIQCRKQACVSDSFVDFFFLEQLVKTSSYSEMSVWLLTCETDAWCDLFV